MNNILNFCILGLILFISFVDIVLQIENVWIVKCSFFAFTYIILGLSKVNTSIFKSKNISIGLFTLTWRVHSNLYQINWNIFTWFHNTFKNIDNKLAYDFYFYTRKHNSVYWCPYPAMWMVKD